MEKTTNQRAWFLVLPVLALLLKALENTPPHMGLPFQTPLITEITLGSW